MKRRRISLGKMLIGAFLLAGAGVVPAPAAGIGASASGAAASPAQSGKQLTCVVQDGYGPVSGANVTVKGTTIGNITDADGKAVLQNVPADAVLVVSYIGYITQEVAAGGRSTVEVTLSEDTQRLEEVVVVGYGMQKKVNLSGSVSSINVSELTESRPVMNISQALAGAAAGVQVTSSNNKPGSDDASILVRGQGTLNTSSPLVIIDGMEGSISSVNPQDIESISILKDAASSAIYGSRAANGVILITTKSGKSGGIKLEYNGYVSVESIRKTLTPVSNYADYMELINEGYANSNLATIFSQTSIDAWRNATDETLYPNTDWIDETFNSSTATNHNLSMSGGTDKIRFYASFGYLDNPGVMENSGEKKYTARLNLEADVRPWLKLGVNADGRHADRDLGTDNVSNVFTYAAATTPGMTYRAPDGRYGSVQNNEDDPQSGSNNPLRMVNTVEGARKVNAIRSRFFGTVSPLKGLDITASYTFNVTDTQMDKKPVWIDLWNFQTNTVTTSGTGKSYVTASDAKVYRFFGDVTASYNSRFINGRLSLNALAGASQEQYISKSFSTTKYDLVDMNLFALSAATGDASASGSSTEWAMRSYFGRINLGWDEKYLLELNLRADGSSRFLSDKRWGYFPSASAAWRISEESFMGGARAWLDNLKVRVSYGGLGNNSVDNYDALSLFSTSNYVWGNAIAVGVAQTSLANANLTWETTYVTNLGIDFGMLKNRLTGTIDVFHKKTVDILIDLPAPNVHGTSSIPKQNSATVSNKGIELTLGWQDRVRDFSYGINGNVSYIKNNVDKFKGDEYSLSGVNMIKEGLPINSKYMLQVDRIVQTDEDLAIVQEMLEANPNAFAAYGTPEKGDFLYKDVNGDGLINSDDRSIVYEGNSPKFIFGLTLNAAYKGFDLSVLLQGMAGYKSYFQSSQINTPTVRWGYQLNKEVAEGRWYEGRTDATYPRLLQYSDTRNTVASDFYLYDNSYLKIKNIQIGYSIPKPIVNKLTLERIRVYGSLENFFTFTNFKGFDPELRSSFAYPSMKQAVVGINVTF